MSAKVSAKRDRKSLLLTVVDAFSMSKADDAICIAHLSEFMTDALKLVPESNLLPLGWTMLLIMLMATAVRYAVKATSATAPMRHSLPLFLTLILLDATCRYTTQTVRVAAIVGVAGVMFVRKTNLGWLAALSGMIGAVNKLSSNSGSKWLSGVVLAIIVVIAFVGLKMLTESLSASAAFLQMFSCPFLKKQAAVSQEPVHGKFDLGTHDSSKKASFKNPDDGDDPTGSCAGDESTQIPSTVSLAEPEGTRRRQLAGNFIVICWSFLIIGLIKQHHLLKLAVLLLKMHNFYIANFFSTL